MTHPDDGSAERLIGSRQTPPSPGPGLDRAPAGGADEPPSSGRSRARRIARFLATAHGLTLLVGAVFIGLFVALTPPGYGLDEQSHFYRMYQISEGTLFPEFDPAGQTYVALVPRSLYDLEQKGWFDSNTVPRDVPFFHRQDIPDPGAYRVLESAPVNGADRQATDVTQTLPNFPIVYLPSAAAVALARMVGADTGGVALAAKVGAALMYLAMAFVAVWYARRLRLRWLVFTAALLPAALFQASVISADTFANGAALILMAMLLTLLVERRPVGPGTLIGLAAAAGGVVMSKPTYALLALLILVLPAEVFRTRRQEVWYKLGALAGGLVLIGVTLYIASKGTIAVSTQRPGLAASINAVDQLKGLLKDPVHGVVMVGTTVLLYGESWVQGVVGLFGYNTIGVPYPFVIASLLTVVAAAFYSERLRRGPAWAVLGAGVLVVLAIIVLFYLTFNPVGVESAEGIQGRYFIPCVMALCAGSAGVLPIRVAMRRATARMFFPAAITITLTVAVATWWIALS